MSQALHIFKKDVRYLRWELAASALLAVLFVYAQIHRDPTQEANAALAGYLFAVFWAFLCARLIQAEAIPGDRQFWITRPYQWRSLLAAKLLFVVTFISIPFLAADTVVLGWEKFPIVAEVPGLLWSTMLITLGTLILFCAFATLTNGLAQWFLSAIVTAGAAAILESVANRRSWGSVRWVRDHSEVAILFVLGSAILLWQYKRRRTFAARAAIAVGLVASYLFEIHLSSGDAFEFEMRVLKPKVDPAGIQIAFHPVTDRGVRSPGEVISGTHELIRLAFPIDVTGVGEGRDVFSDEVRISISEEGGETMLLGGGPAETLEHGSSGYQQMVTVDREFYEKAKDHPVRLGLKFYLTLLGNPVATVIRPDGRPVPIPGVGLCMASGQDLVETMSCVSALRNPSNLLVMELGPRRDRVLIQTSYSPFPADAEFSPLRWETHGGAAYGYRGQPGYTQTTLTSLEPLAHFRRDLELHNVHLSDYTK